MPALATPTTLWLARTHAPDQTPFAATTLRCATAGEVPGPNQEWEPIADVVQALRASSERADLYTAVAKARAIGPAQTLFEDQAVLAPPLAPTKVLAIGRNYAAHAKELGNEVPSSPLSFFKPPSSLLASGQPLSLPRGYARIDMEAELVLVIGRRARQIAAADAWAHVGAYLMGNDISCRDLQRSDKQWTRAKGFDGFGPVSAFARLSPAAELPPIDALRVRGLLGDELVQDGPTSAMIFDVPTLLEHLSACMTLEVGDLIFTGTPAGVSALEPGMVTRVELDGPPSFALAPVVTPVT